MYITVYIHIYIERESPISYLELCIPTTTILHLYVVALLYITCKVHTVITTRKLNSAPVV